MKMWQCFLILLLPGLAACMSQPERPAPVQDGRQIEGDGGGVQTYGYGESGADALVNAPMADAWDRPAQSSPARLEPAHIAQNAPPGQASSSTVESLVQLADGQEKAGNLNGAAATLERALRIQPRNAVLWHRLASIRFDQGQHARAVSLATKSNSLATGNAGLVRNNWLLIAKSKRATGDAQGAMEAERMAAGG